MRSLLWVLALTVSGAAVAQTLQPSGSVQLPAKAWRVEISPAGDQIAVLCADRKLRLVSLPAGRVDTVLGSETERITAFSYSPDGRWFGVATWDGAVRVVPSSGSAPRAVRPAGGRRVEVLVFSHDSKTLVVAELDRPGEIWDITGEPRMRARLHASFSGPMAAAFSPDDRLLVTADGDTAIRIYQTATGEELARNEDAVLESFAAQFTPDGRLALIGGVDGGLAALDAGTGKSARTFARQKGMVAMVLPMPDSRQVLAAYSDTDDIRKPPEIRMWDLRTGTSQAITVPGDLSGCGIAKGELWLAAVKETGVELYRWR